jgi:hypothetical protein
MPRALPINKAQAWTISNVGHYCEDEGVVLDCDSYDDEFESFDLKCKIKDQAPEQVWRGVQVHPNGWAYFTIWEDGTLEPKEWEE